MVGKPDVDRRTVLKSLGGIAGAAAIGGVGTMALSGGAAAATVAISASNPSKVVNDRGDVTTVTADPGFTVEWSNLDDAVGKAFWLLEAKVGDVEFQPIYRATPWLSSETAGTTGSFTRPSSPGIIERLRIADDDGRPDYESFDFSNLGGGDYASYMDGTSMGGADEYTEDGAVDIKEEVLQNNDPDTDAGYYGAATETAPFDNDNDNGGDGSTEDTRVVLRYTIELQRPNIGLLDWKWFADHDNYDTSWDNDRKAEYAENHVEGVKASDIDFGNSKIVMNGEDGYHEFDNPAGIPYGGLQSHPNHIGVMTDKTEFYVTVENEGSDAGTDGDSNTGAE